MIERTTCRISGEPLTELFSLGNLYVSDFLEASQSSDETSKTPLTMCLGEKSGLVQLKHTADFDKMYKRYWYRSGTNASMKNELKDIATSINGLMPVNKGDAWIDIGCNDGTLFDFVSDDVRKIGFDPTEDSVSFDLELSKGVEFYNDYFSIKEYDGPKAKIITSIAMFYDLENPHEFLNDVYSCLEDDGLWVIQMSYLPLMLEQLAFDNICHEHLEYYSLECLQSLLVGHGFDIVDCQVNPTNGGSCRVYIRKNQADVSKFGTAPYRDVANFRVKSILAYEKTLDLENPDIYNTFFTKIKQLRNETAWFIKKANLDNKSVWAYGASTKGNTLLQFFGLDDISIAGIAERQPRKFGLKTVGTNIPIYSEEEMRKANPDYALVLPWHFISEFKIREKEYLNAGGKFIVPCPYFEVI